MSPGVPPPPRPVPRLASRPLAPSPPRPGLDPTPQVPFTSYLTQVPPLPDPAGFLWRGCPSHAVGTSRKMTRVVPGQAARISCHRRHGAHDCVTLHPSWRGFRHAVIRPAPAAWSRGAGVTAGVTRQAAGAHHWAQKPLMTAPAPGLRPGVVNSSRTQRRQTTRTRHPCRMSRAAVLPRGAESPVWPRFAPAFHGSREFSRTGRRSRTAAASSSSSQNAHDQNAYDRRKHVPARRAASASPPPPPAAHRRFICQASRLTSQSRLV